MSLHPGVDAVPELAGMDRDAAIGTWSRPNAGTGTACACAPTMTGSAAPPATVSSARSRCKGLMRPARPVGDALLYARAALDNYLQVGPGAADNADRTQRLIAELEQRSH